MIGYAMPSRAETLVLAQIGVGPLLIRSLSSPLLLELFADRVHLLPRLGDVDVEVATMVGGEAVGGAVEDDQRLEHGGTAEHVDHFVERLLHARSVDELRGLSAP